MFGILLFNILILFKVSYQSPEQINNYVSLHYTCCILEKKNQEICQKIDCDNFCPNQNWVGDGICDDFNNNQPCNFDGGDCCLEELIIDHCEICQCINTTIEDSECMNSELIGDGICDDLNNIQDCQFDGDDCCDVNSNFNFCYLCECYQEEEDSTAIGNGSCVLTNMTRLIYFSLLSICSFMYEF